MNKILKYIVPLYSYPLPTSSRVSTPLLSPRVCTPLARGRGTGAGAYTCLLWGPVFRAVGVVFVCVCERGGGGGRDLQCSHCREWGSPEREGHRPAAVER